MGRLARSESTDSPARLSWDLLGPSHRYVIRVSGPAVVGDYYGTGQKAGDDSGETPRAMATAAPFERAAMILQGAERRPVSWRVSTWHQPNPRALRMVLSGIEVPLEAELLIKIDPSTGILSRKTVLHHRGSRPDVDIAATLAFCYRIHEPIVDVHYLAGAWAQETQIRHGDGGTPLFLESRAGKTGFAFQPYLALSTKTSTYLCQIFWSGNWILQVDPSLDGAAVFGGLNDWQFRCRLTAGGNDVLRLPTVLFGRFDADINIATQHLHDYRRKHRPNPGLPIPVQFNSWYPYLGEPTAAAMLGLVPLVKQLGCEAFVVDAGWFRTDEDDSAAAWTARTGDWRTSHMRFPNGLREIGASCREQGMRFGLWFEPEVIGSLSAVRRDHPEWLHHLDGEPPPAVSAQSSTWACRARDDTPSNALHGSCRGSASTG
jgi:alpha-galactosidase